MRALVFLLLVVACSSSPNDPGAEPIVLRHAESKQVNAELRVAFAELVEDSRCPASVACAWEGNAAIRLDVATGSGTESVRLNTAGGTAFPREASAAGYTFALVELEPQRQTADPVPVQQYRATIRVTR